MPVVFKAAGTNAAATSTAAQTISVTVPFPSGWTTGDFAILHARLASTSSGTMPAPTGWTQFDGRTSGLAQYFLYWKRLDGTESAPTLSDSFSGAGYLSGTISTYTGVVQDPAVSPISDLTTGSDPFNYGNATDGLTWGSITPSNPGLALALHSITQNYSGKDTFEINWSGNYYAQNTPWTIQYQQNGATGSNTEYNQQLLVEREAHVGIATVPQNYRPNYDTTHSATSYYSAFCLVANPCPFVGYLGTGTTVSQNAAATNNPSVSVNVALPNVSWTAGDIAFLMLGCVSGNGGNIPIAPTVSSDWTLLTTLVPYFSQNKTFYYWRRLQPGDNSWTVSHTTTNGNYGSVGISAAIVVYSGAGVPDDAQTTVTVVGNQQQSVSNTTVNQAPYDNRINLPSIPYASQTRTFLFASIGNNQGNPSHMDSFGQIDERAELLIRADYGWTHGWIGDFGSNIPGSNTPDPLQIVDQQYAQLYSLSYVQIQSLAGFETADTYSGSIYNPPSFTLTATEASDNFSGSLLPNPIITLTGTEGADSFDANLYNFSPTPAPTYVGRASAITASTTSAASRTAAPGAISGATTSDYVYCFVSVLGNTTNVPTAPAGFTQLGTSVTVGSGTTRQIITRVYGGLYNGSNVGTWSVALPAGANTYAISVSAVVYRGVDTSNPLENFITGTSTSTSPVAGLTITSNGSNRLLIQDIVRFGSYTGTQPTGWTERVDINSTTPTSGGAYSEKLNERAQATAGSITHGNETYSNSTAQNANLVGFAIFGPSPADEVIQTSPTEAPDTYSGTMSTAGSAAISGSLASTEAPDIAALAGSVFTPAVLSATEPGDSAAISGSIANATATGVTWNPNDKAASMVLSNGNLSANCGNNNQVGVRATQSYPAGSKIYYEWSEGNITSLDGCAGIYRSDYNLTTVAGYSYYLYSDGNNFFEAMNLPDGSYPNINQQGYPNGVSAPFIVGVAYDEANRTIYFSANGVWLFGGNPNAGTGGYVVEPGTYFPGCTPFSGGTVTANFSKNTAYAVPTGYRTFADDAVAGDSGSLAATEAPDTAAFSGQTSTSGTLGSTEPVDTAGFTGTARTVGSLASTEASDTAAISGSINTAGSLVGTEAADAAAFTGQFSTAGSLAASEALDTAAISGGTSTSGSLAATEAPDTATINAGSVGSGTLAATEAPDTAAFTGSTGTSGSLSATEAPDTASISGSQVTSGSLVASEAQDTAVLTGSLSTSGALVASEAGDVANVSGSIASTGVLASTEAQDTAAFAGSVGNAGILIGQEQPDSASFSGSTSTSGALNATENSDTAAVSGNLATSGTLVATDAPDTCYVSTNQATSGSVEATEAADSASFSGGLSTSGSLASTETADAASIQARITTSGSLASTEGEDTAAFTAAAFIPAVLLASEDQDTASVSATTVTNGALAASESTDQCYATGNVASIGDLLASEPADAASMSGNSGTAGSLAATEGQDTAAIDVGGSAQGDLNATENGDAASFSGAVISQGVLISTEASDAASITATVVNNGTLTAQETGDTATVQAQAVTVGTLSASEGDDSASVSGATSTAGVLIASETPDTAAFDADAYILAFLAASEATDSADVSVTVSNKGDLSATESADTASISADVSAIGDLITSEDPDTAGFAATLSTAGDLASSEAPDTVSFDATAFIGADLAANENTDTASFYSDSFVIGSLVAAEAPDTAAIVATIPVPYADVRMKGQVLTQIRLSGRLNPQIGLKGKITTTVTTKGRLR